VVDFAPKALAPPAITVFQGFPSGALDLASFTVPGGLETGPNEYSATIDWGDGSLGSPPAAGNVNLVGSNLIVSGSHTYAAAGTLHATLTLTDDTGGSAVSVTTVVVAPDVSGQVRVVGLGGPRNPQTQLFDSTGTITNVSGNGIPGPLYLVIHGLPAGVTVTNRDGSTATGLPYVLLNVALLQPGQTFGPVVLEFSDPSLVPFDYAVTTIDGPVGGGPLNSALTTGFVANEGQADPQVQFLAQGAGYSLLLTSGEAVLDLRQPATGAAQATGGLCCACSWSGRMATPRRSDRIRCPAQPTISLAATPADGTPV
jgi:hypothetical protein